MSTSWWTAALIAWPALSLPLGMFVGAFIRAGRRPYDTRPINRR